MTYMMSNEIKNVLDRGMQTFGPECTLLHCSCDHVSTDFYNKHTHTHMRVWIIDIYYRRPHTVCVKQPRSERRDHEQKVRQDVKSVSLHTAASISKDL